MVADDDEIVTMLLSTIAQHEPSLELVGTAGDAREAVAVARMRRPQVVLLDLDMPARRRHAGGHRHPARSCRTRASSRSAPNESQLAMLDMARAGAVGYIVKGAPPAEIVDTIHSSVRF